MISQRIISTALAAIVAVSVILFAYGRYQQKPVVVEKREAAGNPAIRVRNPGNYVKVLSIDGNGTRMIPALQCLAYLEMRSGKPIWELFDMMVGTSSGGLIVAALAAPDETGKARFTAQQLLEAYPKLLSRMHAAPLVHPLLSLEGRTAPKFLTRERQRVLIDLFGKTSQVGETLTTITLPAFVLEQRSPFFFASDQGKSTIPGDGPGRAPIEAGDYFLADAVIAATGDPAVFAPSRITNVEGEQTLTFTGAQLYAGNPTILALGEALLRFPKRQCVVISLGGGTVPTDVPVKPGGWDAIASPDQMVGAAIDGSAVTISHASSLLHRFGSGPVAAYIRLDPTLPASAADPGNFSRANVQELEKAGARLTTEKTATLDRTADFLAAP
jgi:hypothetical protein